jgi:hypothetical protein
MIPRIIRRLALAGMFALMVSGVLFPSVGSDYTSRVSAAPAYGYEEEITYYSDPGLTNYVGTGHIYCNGRGTLTGTSSPYHTEEILNVCCGNVPC